MCKLFRAAVVILISIGACFSSHAAVASWTFESGNGTGTSSSLSFNADAGFSSFLTTPTLGVASANNGISRPTTGGTGTPANGGRLLMQANGTALAGTLTFSLHASAGTFNISTLTFNYNPTDSKSPTSISWSYTVSGGSSGNPANTALSGTGWNSASVN